MAYKWDRYEVNEMYASERDESRSALARMTEFEREFNANAHRAALGVIGEATDDQ